MFWWFTTWTIGLLQMMWSLPIRFQIPTTHVFLSTRIVRSSFQVCQVFKFQNSWHSLYKLLQVSCLLPRLRRDYQYFIASSQQNSTNVLCRVLGTAKENNLSFQTRSVSSLPETNMTPENGWLEYFLVSFWGPAYFQGLLLLVSGMHKWFQPLFVGSFGQFRTCRLSRSGLRW